MFTVKQENQSQLAQSRSDAEQNDSAPTTNRLPYATPRLIVHGQLEKITAFCVGSTCLIAG